MGQGDKEVATKDVNSGIDLGGFRGSPKANKYYWFMAQEGSSWKKNIEMDDITGIDGQMEMEMERR